jgi:anti-anti-sigma factor
MKYYLIVANGKKQGLPIPITVDLFLIGTDQHCQLRSKCEGTGAQHCAFVARHDKVFIRDMDSGFPTLVDGELVPPGEEWPVHAGNRLTVGPLEFVVQFREKPLSQRDLEEWALRCLDVDNEREMREADPEEEFESVRLSKRFVDASQAAATMFDRLQDMRGIVKGRLRVSHQEGITVLRFNDVNLVEESELALVKKEVYDNVTRPNLRVLLDFKNVKRMSSSAVEMIIELYRSLRSRGSSLAMCRVQPHLRSFLDTLNVLQPIPHYDDKRDALMTRW